MFYLEFHEESGDSRKVSFTEGETKSLDFLYEKVDIVFEGEETQDKVTLLVGELNREIPLTKRIVESRAFSDTELLELLRFKGEPDSDFYEKFSRKSFQFIHQTSLGKNSFINNLHWGEFALNLRIDGEHIPVGVIQRNTIIGVPGKGGPMKEIIKVVFGSPHNLIYEKNFVSNDKELFSRGNRDLTALECFKLQHQMLMELKKWNEEEIRLPARVIEEKRRVSYSPSLRMDGKSLRSMASNPSNYFASPAGQLEIEGRRFSLSKLDTLVKSTSYDTNDGRLLINTARDIRNAAAQHVDKLYDDGQGDALNDLNQQLGSEIKLLCERHNLPERNKKAISNPSLMRKLIRCKEIVNLVDRWIYLRELDPHEGESSSNWAFPLNSLDKLWEFFCLERIVQSFEALGLDREDIQIAKNDSDRVICVRGRRGWARIFYEPLIRPGENQSIINLKNPKGIDYKIPIKTHKNIGNRENHFEPDYLVDSNIDGLHKVGILDAKFTPDPSDWTRRTNDIISKYSPWLRKPNGLNLDYLISMVPSKDHHDFYSMVHEELEGPGDTQFGCLALRMQSDDPFAVNHLKSFFAQRATEISENN